MFNKLGQMKDLIRDAGRMRELMKEASESLARLKVTGESASGKVKVTMTGKMEMDSVKIDPSVIGTVSVNELEGMVFYAINDALTKVKNEATQRMAAVTGGESLSDLSQII
ncbi:MAG: YbaB/EbfC family nucleoid-associated protein [bacterium]